MGDDTVLNSRGGPWKRAFASNVAAASANFGSIVQKVFGTPFADATDFKIISVVDIPTAEHPEFVAGAETPNAIMFRFFGRDAENKTFSARVWGLTKGTSTVGSSNVQSWERVLLAQFAITLGNIGGVASTLIEASDFEADTIVLTYGAAQDITIMSPANDLPAWARLDHLGHPLLAVETDDGSSATECNLLYRLLW